MRKIVSETVDVLGEITGDSEILLEAVRAITADPDLLSIETSNKVLQVILKNSKGHLRHVSAKNGLDSLSNLLTVFKLSEMVGEASSLKNSYLTTMEATRSVLNAIGSCDKPF